VKISVHRKGHSLSGGAVRATGAGAAAGDGDEDEGVTLGISE
jgi:hypothetical protein